jgi:hypothetical protein
LDETVLRPFTPRGAPWALTVRATTTSAAFSRDKARAVPDHQPGNPTHGRLDVRDGPDVGLVSGRRGGEITRRFKEVNDGRLPE